MNTVRVNVPDLATKVLKLKVYSNNTRKLVISSNWLTFFGFTKGTSVIEEPIGEQSGLCIRLAEAPEISNKKVYERSYTRRQNKLFETQTETSSQKVMNRAFSEACTHVHISFEFGKIIIRELKDHLAERMAQFFKAKGKFKTLAVCSSGVDLSCLDKEAFDIEGLIEYRAPEKRDGYDLSETGALAAIINNPIKRVFNEDIYKLDSQMVAEHLGHIDFMSISLACEDVSKVKRPAEKEKAIKDLSTTVDMVFPALNLVKNVLPTTLLLEQVPDFFSHQMYTLWTLTLRRLGYQITDSIECSDQYDGLTNRKRLFSFATLLEVPFEFIKPVAIEQRTAETFWREHIEPYLADCRDITHTKSLQDGLKEGSLNVVDRNSVRAGTLLRCQAQQVSEMLVVSPEEGKYLYPSPELLKHIMGMDDYYLENLSIETSTQIIGQAVEVKKYRALTEQVKDYLSQFRSYFVSQPTAKQSSLINFDQYNLAV